MSRFRLTFTVDLTGEHEVADEDAATEKAAEIWKAFRGPGVMLPVATIAPHPFPRPEEVEPQ